MVHSEIMPFLRLPRRGEERSVFASLMQIAFGRICLPSRNLHRPRSVFNTSGTDNPRSGRGSANLGWLGRSGRSDVLDKPFQFFVRLSADHEVFTCEKSRHCIDAVGSATAPVFIYRCFDAPAQQNIPGFVSRESDSLGDFDESLDFSDIL